jgi:hypothetical protein
MMKIYDLWPDTDKFDGLSYKSKSDITMSHRFTGISLSTSWIPIEVVYFNQRARGDYPGLLAGIPPVLTEKSLRVLLPYIEQDVEVLPLSCETEKLYAINVLAVIDCLDLEQSKYTKFENSDRVMHIEQYKFYEESLARRYIFRLPDWLSSRVYTLDSFKNIVESNGLRGFRFKQVQ